MQTILFRTLFIYLILFLILRLMGKRQIGELEITDLVTTLLLSEIASLPITNQELPISYAIIPMVTLLFLEVTSSVVLIRFPRLKFLVSARPTVIIEKGELRQAALRALRISMDELVSELRQQGYTSLEQIDCAIVEKNGKLTLLPKSAYAPPTAADLNLSLPPTALMHIVYNNGAISQTGLSLIGKNESWLREEMKQQGIEESHVFCITADANGKLYVIPKEETA
ncbi:MAG: DUF421 domain-containing protein [Clostridia bacterium]|nr:DUF421 domain-containing protein [Clostridia bacterium]